MCVKLKGKYTRANTQCRRRETEEHVSDLWLGLIFIPRKLQRYFQRKKENTTPFLTNNGSCRRHGFEFQFVHSGNMQKVTLYMAQSVSTVWLYNSQWGESCIVLETLIHCSSWEPSEKPYAQIQHNISSCQGAENVVKPCQLLKRNHKACMIIVEKVMGLSS